MGKEIVDSLRCQDKSCENLGLQGSASKQQQATAMWKQPQSSFSVEPPSSPGGAGLTVEHCEREHRECRDEGHDEGREGLETVPTVLTINPEVETVEKVESAEQRALRGRVSSRHVAVAVCTSGCARHDRVSINGRAKVSTRRRLTFELCHNYVCKYRAMFAQCHDFVITMFEIA